MGKGQSKPATAASASASSTGSASGPDLSGQDAEDWYNTLDRQYKTAMKATLRKKFERERGKVEEAVSRIKATQAGSPLSNFVFVLGGPGSGKGTQSKRVADEFGFIHLSLGELLRSEIQEDSDLGKKAKPLVESGQLVPLEIVLAVLNKAMRANEYQTTGYLLDGFPREMAQLEAFEKEAGACLFALYFALDDATMKSRCLSRERSDDSDEAIDKRIQVFHSQSEDVIKKLKSDKKVEEIDASKSPDDVFKAVRETFIKHGFSVEKYNREAFAGVVKKAEAIVAGTDKSESATTDVSAPKGSKKALVIGLDYKEVDFARCLKCAASDAKSFAASLEKTFDFEVLLLTDDQTPKPTKGTIMNALKKFVSSCVSGDALCLYFAGHGVRVKDTKGTAHECLLATDLPIADTEIAGVLKQLKSDIKVTVVLDVTFQGQTLAEIPEWPQINNGTMVAAYSMSEKSIKATADARSERVFTYCLNTLLETKGYSVDYLTLKEHLHQVLKPFDHTLVITDVGPDPEEVFFLDKVPVKLPAN